MSSLHANISAQLGQVNTYLSLLVIIWGTCKGGKDDMLVSSDQWDFAAVTYSRVEENP
jgi:hypothetical protein